MEALKFIKIKKACDYIDQWLELNFHDSVIPGMQVSISFEQDIIYSRSFGYSNISSGSKMANNHRFRIASLSKVFTATAILQLMEQNLLALDDKVSAHLKWFKSIVDSDIQNITIRQLLNHTSGISRDGEDSNFWQLERPFLKEKDLKEFIKNTKLVFPSDDRLKYSNLGFSYLGLVIEAVSGQPYRDFINQNILLPLELSSTDCDIDGEDTVDLTVGYAKKVFSKEPQPLDHTPANGMSPATGFYSTAEDLAKFFSMLTLDTPGLLTNASKRMMQHGYWQANYTEKYGLGIVEYEKAYGHDGSFPGFSSTTMFDPFKKFVVTVLTNYSDSQTSRICKGMVDFVNFFLNSDISADEQTASKYQGRFYTIWGATDIISVGSNILSLYPQYWSGVDEANYLNAIDETKLRIDTRNGYDSPGEMVDYQFDSTGAVASINYAGMTMLPLEKAIKKGWAKDYRL